MCEKSKVGLIIIFAPFIALLACGVAAQVVTKVGNAFLAVFLIYFGTVVAGVARSLGQVGSVTIGAFRINVRTVKRES